VIEGTMNYILELFLSPGARNVMNAIGNLKEILKKLPAGTHRVILLDVAAEPEAAERAGVIATPTLIRRQPKPEIQIIGDFSDREAVLSALLNTASLPGANARVIKTRGATPCKGQGQAASVTPPLETDRMRWVTTRHAPGP
jgi:circadian clock protein KaiB